MIRLILYAVGLSFVPIIYASLMMVGLHTQIKDLYLDLYCHYHSGLAFGVFDEGI